MTMPIPCAAVVSLALLPAFALAQAGNEVVFVGSSTSGTTDRHAFVESGGPLLVATANSSFTDNVSGAVWADTGRTLFVAQTLQSQVAVGAWDGANVTWSLLHDAPYACCGIAHDAARKRVWTLVSNAGSSELRCLDANPASATYGAMLAETTTLNGPIRELWAMARSGNFAVVPNGTVSSGPFQIVDTDPASPTFLQVVVSAPVPTAQALGFSFCFDCEVSLDEAYCYMVYAGVGFSACAVWDRAAGAFLDFDASSAGQQDLMLGNVTANAMALSLDRSFALVSSNKAPGQVLRCDFDYVTPANSTVTALAGASAPFANGVSLSPDGARACVTSTAQQFAGPGTLVFFNPLTGVASSTVALGSMWNLYTTAWQDGSPNGVFTSFGAGCPGALGEPALAGVRPRLGFAFPVTAGNLPLNLAVLAVGFSNVASSGLPLPLPLAGIGMPGCSLLVDPAATVTLVGSAGTASWSLAIPNDPLLFGFPVYFQSFPLDPAANALGLSASAGGAAILGL